MKRFPSATVVVARLATVITINALLCLLLSSSSSFTDALVVVSPSPLVKSSSRISTTSTQSRRRQQQSSLYAIDVSTVAATTAAVDPIVLGGVAVVALGGIAAFAATTMNAGGSLSSKATTAAKQKKDLEPEPEPIDVSIPYDAAALLEYQKVNASNGSIDDQGFAAFNKMYKEVTVAEIKLKQEQAKVKALKEKFQSTFPATSVNGASGIATTTTSKTEEESVEA